MKLNKKKLKNRFYRLFGTQNELDIDLSKIEKKLDVNLPEDFKKISKFYDGNNGFYLDGMLCHNPNLSPDNILSKTLFYRDKQLPKKFIVLGEPPESIILMETVDSDMKIPHILWLSYADLDNLCQEKALNDSPIIYKSFSEFFDYLLTEEEIDVLESSNSP